MSLLAETSASSAAFLLVLFVFVLGLLMIGLVIFLFVFWVLMVIDAVQRKDWASEDEKMIWVIVLAISLFIGFWGIAAIVYYFAIKKPRQNSAVAHEPIEAEVVKTPPKQPKSKQSVRSKSAKKKS